MKTMIILICAIILLVTLNVTRYLFEQSTKPTLAEWSRLPITESDMNQLRYDTHVQQFNRRKLHIMVKYNSFVAQIYRHQADGEMVLHCLGTMISGSSLITSKECAISPQTLMIVFKCHKLDEQNLPTEVSRNLESEVTNLVEIGASCLISVHPSRPSERCVVLWTRDYSPPTDALLENDINVG